MSLDGCGHVAAVDQGPQFEVPVEGRAGEVGAGQEDISTAGFDGLGVQACVRKALLVDPDEDAAAPSPPPDLLCDSSTRSTRTPLSMAASRASTTAAILYEKKRRSSGARPPRPPRRVRPSR